MSFSRTHPLESAAARRPLHALLALAEKGIGELVQLQQQALSN